MFKELKRVTCQVRDLDAARQWYETVLGTEPVFDSAVACIFRIGGNTLSLVPSSSVPDSSGRITAYWEVDDVDAAYARLTDLGARAVVPPRNALTIRTAQVEDPFGTVLGLCGPIANDVHATVETQPSRTAHAVALCRALMNRETREALRLEDPYSELFLDADVRPRLVDPTVRKAIVDTRISGPLYGFFIARSRFGDEAFRRALADRVPQIVYLGAGYDTRALRFRDALGETRVFELDAAPTQQRKIACLESSGTAVPPQLRFIPVDFRTDDVMARLRDAGYDAARPALFVWEGVTYYLPIELVEQVFASIRAQSGAGSRVVFDYMTKQAEWVNSGEPFLSWMEPADVPARLQRLGFHLREHLDAPEMTTRYLTLADGTVGEKTLSNIRLACADHA
jgi:methyltransferase (TIGR00027 family)